MTDVLGPFRLETSNEPEPALEPVSASHILITEQEVVFGTAAAVRVQPAATWRSRATRMIAAVSRRVFLTSPTADARPKQRYYPRRSSYLDRALMAREMYRL